MDDGKNTLSTDGSLINLLTNACQIFDGWKQTAPDEWSEFDEQTRRGMSEWLAYLHNHPDTFEDGSTGEANARLIAAAPELLEALKAMVAIAQQDDWHNAFTGRQLVLEEAEAAIRKAGGA